jgi:hypothetical protein
MLMASLWLMSPTLDGPPEPGLLQSLVERCALPDDGVQHVYVRSVSSKRVDVVLFLAANDLVGAQMNVTVFCSRLLATELAGWELRQVRLEDPSRVAWGYGSWKFPRNGA